MSITDTALLNKQVFTNGNIQVSPLHMMQLNMKQPIQFKPKVHKINANHGYRVFLTGYANYVLDSEKRTYIYFSLEKILNQLRANPRPLQAGAQMKNTVDTRIISTGSYHVWYKIISGQVVVFNIEVQDEAQLARDRLEKPGLYKIKRDSQGVWIKERVVDDVDTKYAAVNGMLNNLNKATWLMGSHLDYEFGKNNLKDYTLFHNPTRDFYPDLWESIQDKLGFSTGATRKFSEVLQKSQNKGKEIKWVAHSQGGIIFAEAVRYFLNGNSSWAILGGFNGIFKDKNKIDLSNHKVSFHGNANNDFRSSFLFDRAGIEVLSKRSNNYDVVNVWAGFNSINPFRYLGSLVYAPHVKNGSVFQSTHTLAQDQKDWENHMDNGLGRGRNFAQNAYNTVIQPSARYINNFLK